MGDPGSEPPVRVAIDRGVATITLDSPANRNALSRALVAGLHDALDEASGPGTRVIVLTHTGNTFCAGADLKERSESPIDSSPMVRAMRRLSEGAVPTIAAVKGAVRAGGIGLMAACDLVVVTASATFAFTEVRIGVAPAIISVPILARVTPSLLRAPFLTGEAFDAAAAKAMGLVTHVAADEGDVDRTVATLVDGVLAGAPTAVAATKALLRRVPTLDTDAAYAEMQAVSEALFVSADAAEGMAAFREKRTPSWSATRG